MKFRADELEFNASIVESSQSPSPRTGSELQTMTIQFRAQKDVIHEQALAAAHKRASGGLFSLDESGQPEMEWRILDSSSTYVGTEPWGIHHHVWRVEQVERLACERLRLDSVELQPYDYAEEVSQADGVVRLAARARISETDLETISRIAGPISVVRLGISNTPRHMRLSGYVWGERDDGLAVVVACEDVREPRVTLAGWQAPADGDIEDLLAVLAVDTEQLRQRRHARRRVADVDAWGL